MPTALTAQETLGRLHLPTLVRFDRCREKPMGEGRLLRSNRAETIAELARYLERNHDIARGALDRLVQNVVGPQGIAIEPQPRNKDGEILPLTN